MNFKKVTLVLFFIFISIPLLGSEPKELALLYCKNFIYKSPNSIVYEECSKELFFEKDYFLLHFSGGSLSGGLPSGGLLKQSQYYGENLESIQNFFYGKQGELLQKEEVQVLISGKQESRVDKFFTWNGRSFVLSGREEEIRMPNGISYRLMYSQKTRRYQNHRLQSILYSAKTKEKGWADILEVFYLQDAIQGYHVTRSMRYSSKVFRQEEFSWGDQRWITWYDLEDRPRLSFDLGEDHKYFSLYFYSGLDSGMDSGMEKKARVLQRQQYEFADSSFSNNLERLWFDYYQKFEGRKYRLSQKEDFWEEALLPFFEKALLWKHRFWYFDTDTEMDTEGVAKGLRYPQTRGVFPFDMNLEKIEDYRNNQAIQVRYYDEKSELEKIERYTSQGKRIQ